MQNKKDSHNYIGKKNHTCFLEGKDERADPSACYNPDILFCFIHS